MALVEGGPFHCGIHDFKTEDVEAWNEHMDDGEHFDEGTSTCVDCQTPIKFRVPYAPFREDGTKGVRERYQLRCEDCSSKVGSAEVSKL